jgi:hypothetical protein
MGACHSGQLIRVDAGSARGVRRVDCRIKQAHERRRAASWMSRFMAETSKVSARLNIMSAGWLVLPICQP